MSLAPWATTAAQKPHGFRVTIERAGARGPERHTFPSKTKNRASAVQAATYKKGFRRLISAEPLNREEWDRVFGGRR
jgi:hypothetical protein